MAQTMLARVALGLHSLGQLALSDKRVVLLLLLWRALEKVPCSCDLCDLVLERGEARCGLHLLLQNEVGLLAVEGGHGHVLGV